MPPSLTDLDIIVLEAVATLTAKKVKVSHGTILRYGRGRLGDDSWKSHNSESRVTARLHKHGLLYALRLTRKGRRALLAARRKRPTPEAMGRQAARAARKEGG